MTHHKIKIKRYIGKKKKHPSSWSKNLHYGQCGQSCPCCRFIAESSLEPKYRSWFGVCKICAFAR